MGTAPWGPRFNATVTWPLQDTCHPKMEDFIPMLPPAMGRLKAAEPAPRSTNSHHWPIRRCLQRGGRPSQLFFTLIACLWLCRSQTVLHSDASGDPPSNVSKCGGLNDWSYTVKGVVWNGAGCEKGSLTIEIRLNATRCNFRKHRT